ncbi:hypothetical protein R1flu_022098 [Riccia fluitans]|uniref:RING-CH-type domain-containing protein n=1 Tax=Riccia fluitans TaxID=41844 RepID=A0ABD1ZR87_9MARC
MDRFEGGADGGRRSDSHVIDIDVAKDDRELDSCETNPSTLIDENSVGNLCRICQLHSEEALVVLGCHCRGELAKAHETCMERWFGSKGTNNCEICHKVATNVPRHVLSTPSRYFWDWRLRGVPAVPTRNDESRVIMRAVIEQVVGALLCLSVVLFLNGIVLRGYTMNIRVLVGTLIVVVLVATSRIILEIYHRCIMQRNLRRILGEVPQRPMESQQELSATSVAVGR